MKAAPACAPGEEVPAATEELHDDEEEQVAVKAADVQVVEV
jgi:hypothetical protein